jgi:hypothetical protein
VAIELWRGVAQAQAACGYTPRAPAATLSAALQLQQLMCLRGFAAPSVASGCAEVLPRLMQALSPLVSVARACAPPCLACDPLPPALLGTSAAPLQHPCNRRPAAAQVKLTDEQCAALCCVGPGASALAWAAASASERSLADSLDAAHHPKLASLQELLRPLR